MGDTIEFFRENPGIILFQARGRGMGGVFVMGMGNWRIRFV
jgi:hypothetical protein